MDAVAITLQLPHIIFEIDLVQGYGPGGTGSNLPRSDGLVVVSTLLYAIRSVATGGTALTGNLVNRNSSTEWAKSCSFDSLFCCSDLPVLYLRELSKVAPKAGHLGALPSVARICLDASLAFPLVSAN